MEGALISCNVTMDDGPSDLGDKSKINSDGERNAIYFTRANLCITIICYGREDFEIMDLARAVDENIVNFPESDFESLILSAPDDSISLGQEVEISYSLEWNISESGYYKFFATNGNLSINNNSITFRPSITGQATITGFAIEPGKPTFSGRLNLTVT